MFCMLFFVRLFFFFKQKTAYEMRISDWSSDVCSSDLTCCSNGFAAGGAEVCALSVRCMRSCRPFSCGEAGWMKCGAMPSLIHQTDSLVRPEIGRASCRERVCQYV